MPKAELAELIERVPFIVSVGTEQLSVVKFVVGITTPTPEPDGTGGAVLLPRMNDPHVNAAVPEPVILVVMPPVLLL